MANAFGVWQPSAPGDNSPQVWTNTQTGQQVYGSFNGLSGIKLIDRTTGQPTGYHALVNGQQHKDDSMLHQLGVSALKLAPFVGVPLAAKLFSGAAPSGGSPDTATGLPDSGPTSAYTTDPVTGDINGYNPGYGPNSPSNLAPKLVQAGADATGLGLMAGSRNPAQAQNAPLMAALNTLLPQLQQRFNQTQPLFGNVVNMAHGMLPKAYQ